MKTNIKSYLLSAASVLIFVLLDQWTKVLAVTHLKNQSPIVLIEHVFELHYLENRGAAFGLLQDQRIFFLIIAFVILAVVAVLYRKIPDDRKFIILKICSVFICAGAIGNMIDRFLNGYVVDFLYFSLIDFPIFNVADIYVTVSTFVLVFLILFYYKEEDIEKIFHSGR